MVPLVVEVAQHRVRTRREPAVSFAFHKLPGLRRTARHAHRLRCVCGWDVDIGVLARAGLVVVVKWFLVVADRVAPEDEKQYQHGQAEKDVQSTTDPVSNAALESGSVPTVGRRSIDCVSSLDLHLKIELINYIRRIQILLCSVHRKSKYTCWRLGLPNSIMYFYNKIRSNSVDTREVWTELIRSESEFSEDDAIECFRHFREPPRKGQQHKNDLAFEELCQNTVQTLREILRTDQEPQQEDLTFLYSVKSHAKYPMLWNTIDLILKFHKFARVLESSKHIVLLQSLPVLEKLLPVIADLKGDDYQLYLVSKMYLIVSIYYLNLYGVTMRERMHKLLRKSLVLRQHIHQKWPTQLSILQMPTYVGHSYLKILRIKKADKDYQKKLIFNLKKNLGRLLHKRRDSTLQAINRQVSGFLQQLGAQPQIYSESLQTAIKKSNSLYNFSTQNVKRSKLMQNNSNVISVVSMIKKHREISINTFGKTTNMMLKTIGTLKKNLINIRKEPDRLKLNTVDFGEADTYFKKPHHFVFRMLFDGKIIQVYSEVCVDKLQTQMIGNIKIKIGSKQLKALIILNTNYCVQSEKQKVTTKQVLIKSIKSLFPLSNDLIYLPLIKADLSDLECYQKALQSLNPIVHELHITHINEVRFLAFIKDLLVQGCRSSLKLSKKLIGYGFGIKTSSQLQAQLAKHRRKGKFLELVVAGNGKRPNNKWVWKGVIKNKGYQMLFFKLVTEKNEQKVSEEWIKLLDGIPNSYLTLIVQQFKNNLKVLHQTKKITCQYFLSQINLLMNQAMSQLLQKNENLLSEPLENRITLDFDLPIDQKYPSTDIKYHIPDENTLKRKQQFYKQISQQPQKIITRRRIWFGNTSKYLITEVSKCQQFRVLKIYDYNTVIKMPLKTNLDKYQFQLLRIQTYRRVFAMKKGKSNLVLAQTKPSIFLNYPYHYQSKNRQLCITKFGYDCVFQVFKTVFAKVSNGFAIVNIYKDEDKYIYEVYDPITAKKSYAKHQQLFRVFNINLKSFIINGTKLQSRILRYQKDIRYCFCEAKGYAESSG